MVRTQIQFTESQLTALRRLAAKTGRSISELVRSSVEDHLRSIHMPSVEERRQAARRLAGAFSSGRSDVSAEHDRELAEAYRK